jgi:hypothetical protein
MSVQYYASENGGSLLNVTDRIEELRAATKNLVDAMRRYEMDAEGDAPRDHREMMDRAIAALGE